jgi:hypothetical protein
MHNFNEILKSFIISVSPTSIQQELANKRLEICNACEAKKIILNKLKPTTICGKCKCVLHKKIFTPLKGKCPLGKWDIIEEEKYFLSKKDDNTII